MARKKSPKPTTVYLGPGRAKALKRRAEATGLTMAEHIRRGIDSVLMADVIPAVPSVSDVRPPTDVAPSSSIAGQPQPTSTPGVTMRPATGEVGVSGTVIWSGVLNTEANSRLQNEKGYGSPGSQEWGEWEKLERTDHAVASALALISAPLRDSTLEVEPAPEPEIAALPASPGASDEDDGGNDAANVLANLDEGLPAALNRSALPAEPMEEPASDEAPGDDPSAVIQAMAGPSQNEVIASFVRDCLQKWLAPGWSMLAEQIAHYGLAYGFYLGEEVWATRPDARVSGGTAWYVKRLAQRLPSSIQSNGWVEENGELATIRQAGVRDGRWFYNLQLPASKCLLASWNRNGNNYRGFPAFRPVWYIGQQRADLLRILGIGSAREALGILSVETEKDVSLSNEQRADLQDFIENAHAHESLSVQLPPGTKLNWLTSSGANKGHVLDLWKALGLAVYETVQAQQTTLGTGETGSRSVGEVHDASRNAFVNGVRAWIEAVLNGIGEQPYTGLVRKLVDANFGPQDEYPRVKISLKKPEISLDVFATALKTLIDAGAITVGVDDENDVRERLGWSPVDPAERAAEKARKAAIATAISGGRPPPNAPSSGPPLRPGGGAEGNASPSISPAAPPPDPEAAQRAAAKMSEQLMPFVPRRSLRPAERLLNLADINDFFEGGRERFESTVRPIVEEMVRGSAGQVREAMRDGDPSELKTLKLNTRVLAKAVELFVESSRAFGYRQARLELEKQGVKTLGAGEMPSAMSESVAKFLAVSFDPLTSNVRSNIEWTKTKNDLIGVVKTEWKPATLTDQDLANLVSAQARMVVERIGGRLKQQVWDSAVDAVRRGQSPDDALQSVLDSLEESKALRGDAELVLSRSFGMGREQLIQEQAENIDALEYSAVLDKSTCDPCASVDGKQFLPNSPEHFALLTPYRECDGKQRCRCVLIPLVATSNPADVGWRALG